MSATGRLKAVLFDLDGTLLDTAPDMVGSLCALLHEESRAPIDYEHARAHVSKGALGLIDIAFGQLVETKRQALRERYLEIYASRLAEGTVLFEGMAEVLAQLGQDRIPWGVITNKPGFLTDPLLESLDLMGRCACVVSGDTLAERKPHPAPLRHAAELIGVAATAAAYIGDDQRDMTAGRAAGMLTVAATYGFIPPDEDPDRWDADHKIAHPLQLLAILRDHG